MKLQLGFGLSDARGKVGGVVASKNRGGNYMRRKVTPVNPRTQFQLKNRSRFGVLATLYKGLTEDQRNAWIAAVRDFQKTNVFGDLKQPSGIALYIRCNQTLFNADSPAITLPGIAGSVNTVFINSAAAANGAQTFTVTLSANVPSGVRAVIYATTSLSPGINFAKNRLRKVSSHPAAAVSPINIASAYIARFGAIGAAGNVIWIGVQFVSITSGLASPMQMYKVIIAA